MTVATSTREIEILDSLLFDSQFQHIEPATTTFFNMYSVLSRAREGTDEHALFERITSNGKVYETASMNVMISDMSNHFDDIANGEIAMIENSQVMHFLSKYIGFFYTPESINNIVESKEDISLSPLGCLVSKQLIPNATKIMKHRVIYVSICEYYM